MSEAMPFDPTSSANVTACVTILVALASTVYASYSLGRNTGDKGGGGFKVGMFGVVSGIFVFWAGLYVLFAYD